MCVYVHGMIVHVSRSISYVVKTLIPSLIPYLAIL